MLLCASVWEGIRSESSLWLCPTNPAHRKDPAFQNADVTIRPRPSLSVPRGQRRLWSLAAERRSRPRAGARFRAAEAEELWTQLRLLEDAFDGLWRELLEAQCKLPESQEGREVQRQEAGKLRHRLGDGAKEPEALQRSNEELWATVKKAESERISLKLANEDKEQKLALLEEARTAMGKEARELRTGLQEVERSRLEARRELQELRRQEAGKGSAAPAP
nr:rootletin-like [Pongo abelii]